jgi:hypothetical protein
MLAALGLRSRRHQTGPERRNARRGDDVDGGVEDDAWHADRLGRDQRAEEQQLAEKRGRPVTFQLLAYVGRERRRGADREPIADPRELLGRIGAPVADEVRFR